MTGVSIVPAGAGTATATLYREGPGEEVSYTGWWKTYRLAAEPADGFEFVRFEWDYKYTRDGVSTTGTNSSSTNPYAEETPDWFGGLCEYDIDYHDPESHWEQSITAVRAIFSSTVGTVRVTVEISPDGATAAGCSATVDGASESEKTGAIASTVSFGLDAYAPDGWKFRYWKRNGSKYGKSDSLEIGEVVPDGISVVQFVAVFTEVTGEILHADDGLILHGSSGVPLFKG